VKVLFFDVGYTLVNEDAVWKKRCREQAEMEEAKKLGMKTVWIKQGFGALQKPESPSEEPDYTICRLSELLKIFIENNYLLCYPSTGEFGIL
jgi:FMN phosphatase YigB (HAD superfamily)